MILIVGGGGAQGKRYQSILRYLHRPFIAVDSLWGDDNPKEVMKNKEISDVILTTPTPTHIALLKEYLPYGKPILCEKPIATDLREIKDLPWEADISMVYQYKQLIDPGRPRLPSFYDYFRHGNDGLIWDCLQIISLASSEVQVFQDSPVWKCTINGRGLNLSSMDFAYIKEVQWWLLGNRHDRGEIIAAHEKTADYFERAKKGIA